MDKLVKIGKGHYFVIGARPSQGKTALSLQMAVSMAERHKVLYFSFETSADRLYERIMARQANVDYGKIVEGTLSDLEVEKIKTLQPYFENIDLLVIEAAGMTVTKLRRIQDGSLKLGNLPLGKWRNLTNEEVAGLK